MIDRVRTWQNVVDRYVDECMSGEKVVGATTIATISRYLDDLKTAENRGFYLDYDIAERHLKNWSLLFSHSTGEYAGQPFIPCPWQAFNLWNIFGWRRKSDGTRRFRSCYLSVGRGNGKSPLGAGILLTCQVADIPREVKAQCFCAATTREQAKLVFSEATHMVHNSPALRKLVQIRSHELLVPQDGSSIKPLASDGRNIHGLVIHAVVIDELHVWKEQHRALREAIDTALGKRRQPLSVIITTAGDSESLLWSEEYEYSKAVAYRQTEADAHFSCIYEIDDNDDPLDEAVWPKANPMLEHGVVKIDYLRASADKARTSAENLTGFKRYHCNRQVESHQQIITAERWSKGDWACEKPAGRAFLGFDWGWRDDLTALARCHPYDTVDVDGTQKKAYAIYVDVWTPEECPRDLTREPWKSWIRDGFVRITEGNTTDTEAVYKRVAEIRGEYGIGGIVYDGNNCREFGSKCVNEWRLKATAIGHSGITYHEPLRELLCALDEGRLSHGGNPILAWAAMNMVTKTSTSGVNEYMYPMKRKSKDKIDPIITVIYSIAAVMWHGTTRQSIYETKQLARW